MTQQGPHKATVDGEDYEFYHLPTSRALKTLTRLSKVLMGPLADFVKALDSGNKATASMLDKDINMDVVAEAIQNLSTRLDEEEVLSLAKELTSCVRLGTGMEVHFEEHFSGRIGHLFNVSKTSAEHNFKDFFNALSGMATRARAVMAKRTPSTPVPTQ